MVPLVADENFYGPIFRALVQRKPSLDIVRVQDVGLMGTDDPKILKWAAQRNRVLLTHDRETIPDFAYERVRNGREMAGVIIVPDQLAPGDFATEILSLLERATEEAFRNRVFFLSV